MPTSLPPPRSDGPLVILATGQSNIANVLTYSWAPAPNLRIWNNTPDVAGSVGTQFLPGDATKISYARSLANELAKAYPKRTVYLINIGKSGQAIAQWMAGASSPDVYADCQANVVPALAALGVSKIDVLVWWQGEADAGLANSGDADQYVTDFETVMTRFKAEAWFPLTTPIVLSGIVSGAISGTAGYGWMNPYLQACANADPMNRIFTYPAFLPAGFWEGVGNVHLTATGYELAGAAAAHAFLGRTGPRSSGFFVVDYETGRVGLGPLSRHPGGYLTVNRNSKPYQPSTALIQAVAPDGGNAQFEARSFAGSSQFMGRRANGTGTTPTPVVSGDPIVTFGAIGYKATDWSTSGPSITLRGSATWTDTSTPGAVEFNIVKVGTTSNFRAGSFKETGAFNLRAMLFADLPAAGAGDMQYCSNARKTGEGAGAGTGCLLYYDGIWRRVSDDAAAVA